MSQHLLDSFAEYISPPLSSGEDQVRTCSRTGGPGDNVGTNTGQEWVPLALGAGLYIARLNPGDQLASAHHSPHVVAAYE